MNASPAAPLDQATPTPSRPLASGFDIRLARRKFANGAMWFFAILFTVLAIIPLVLVLFHLLRNGLPNLNLDFFTKIQPAPGEKTGGGMNHSIIGTLMMIGIAMCIGLPFGLFGGIYLAEFGQNRFGGLVRFAADVLNGIPSIVIGIFVYTVAVLPATKATEGRVTFSAWAGGLALGIMMVPTIMRTTEEIVRLVPMSMREAALALGSTRWLAVFKVVLNAAKGGIITGILLAIARISGETAPLLFTALSNNFRNTNPSQPTAALPTTIYSFASSPDNHWIDLAWTGSLVLVSMILILSIAARYFTQGRGRKM